VHFNIAYYKLIHECQKGLDLELSDIRDNISLEEFKKKVEKASISKYFEEKKKTGVIPQNYEELNQEIQKLQQYSSYIFQVHQFRTHFDQLQKTFGFIVFVKEETSALNLKQIQSDLKKVHSKSYCSVM